MEEKYESPSVEMMEVEVERGFAATGGNSAGENPDFNDGGQIEAFVDGGDFSF